MKIDNSNIALQPTTVDQIDCQNDSDEHLMQRYAKGELAAFETLYLRHKGGVYRYFMRQIPNHTLAEDLFQDIWSVVITKAASYKTSAKFTTWLYTLAHNKLVDHIRHLSVVNKIVVGNGAQRNDQNTERDEQHGGNDAQEGQDTTGRIEPDKQLNSQRLNASLLLCIGKLPQAQKDSFLLKEEAGLSVKEIATVLHTSFEASKSRLRYAYENLKQCIELKTGRSLV